MIIMKLLSKLILMFVALLALCSSAIDEQDHDVIPPVISAFKQRDKKAIAALIKYPLRRDTVIPPIQNEAELINRFDEVFDEILIEKIASSDPAKDWRGEGWRGISFSDGELWLDADGTIWTITYQTEKEAKLRKSLIEKQKLTLHKSIRVYEHPILEWKTKKFRIRIDYLGEHLGKHQYRYASWGANKPTSDKPDLVLANGKIVFDGGSGGNHYFEFTNGKHTYRCDVCVLGRDDSPPGFLEVYKGDKLILSEAVIEVLNH